MTSAYCLIFKFVAPSRRYLWIFFKVKANPVQNALSVPLFSSRGEFETGLFTVQTNERRSTNNDMFNLKSLTWYFFVAILGIASTAVPYTTPPYRKYNRNTATEHKFETNI